MSSDITTTAELDVDETAATAPSLVATAWLEGREVARMSLDGVARVVVGRSSGCDLVIAHVTVSHRHLEMEPGSGAVKVRDLSTRNGTTYRGARISEAQVGPGAVLHVGAAEVRIELAGAPPRIAFGSFTSVSPAMRAMFDELGVAAPSESTILIAGETGVGKELLAKAVHQASARASAPFVVVDCGALHKELAGSELFGHVKGAFTGADRDQPGAFEQADRGTLFLDEIGELPLDLQPLLLRALEQRQSRRIGDRSYRSFDLRVLAATNRDLEEEVTAGRFGLDLLYRLAVVKVRIPPLRERKEDLPELVQAILDGMGQRGQQVELSPDLWGALREHDWPGNVRELRNAIERAVLRTNLGPVAPEHIGLAQASPQAETLDYRAARAQALDAFERSFVLHLLKARDNNVSRAARDAGIDRGYLYRLIRRHQIPVREQAEPGPEPEPEPGSGS